MKKIRGLSVNYAAFSYFLYIDVEVRGTQSTARTKMTETVVAAVVQILEMMKNSGYLGHWPDIWATFRTITLLSS